MTEPTRNNAMTIGRVSRLAGVGVQTVRYYERRGLLADPRDGHDGYRHYPADTLDRIRFIKRAQSLGFTLEEVRELLSLRVDPGARCDDVRRRAAQKLESVERKLADMRAMKRSLRKLISACDGRGPADQCPILQALQTDDQHDTN